MARNIVVYGHADKSKDHGFPEEADFNDFIAGGVFRENGGEYSYSKSLDADIIILSRNGLAFGHFEIASMKVPDKADREAHPGVKKVYQVDTSVSYSKPVRLRDLGITNYQFGKQITEEKFLEILQAARDTNTYSP